MSIRISHIIFHVHSSRSMLPLFGTMGRVPAVHQWTLPPAGSLLPSLQGRR